LTRVRGGALVLAVVAAACGGPPQAPSTAGEERAVEVPLRALPGGGFAIAATVSGSRLDLLFDPGAGLTLLVPAAAQALGCRPWGRVRLPEPSGAVADLARCGDMSLTLEGLPLTAATAVLDPVTPRVAAASLDGVASLQTLGALTVTLDLAEERLVIESESSLARRVAAMRPIEARLGRDAAGLAARLYLGVGTERGPLWLLAGGGDRVVLAPHTLDLLGAPPMAPVGSSVEVSLELPGLGRLERRAMVAETPWDGVLDAAALRELVLTVDLHGGRAWAERRAPKNPD